MLNYQETRTLRSRAPYVGYTVLRSIPAHRPLNVRRELAVFVRGTFSLAFMLAPWAVLALL